MKKGKKIALMVAGCMILVGLILAAVGFTAVRFDVSRLNTISYETKTFEIGEAFHHISIDGAGSDVRLYPSEEDTCKVVCTAEDDVSFAVEVKDDTLHIVRHNSGMRILHFGVFLEETGIRIYLPEEAYESLVIHTSSGNVTVPEALQFASAEIRSTSGEIKMLASIEGSLGVQTTSGDIHIGNTEPDRLDVQSTSGDITIEKVKANGEFQVKSTSGEVTLAGVEGKAMTFDTTSGDITLTDVQGKAITAASTSGEITLSRVVLEERIQLKSTSGDIELRDSDGAELSIQTTSGRVSGTLLSEKIFRIDTISGDVNAPYSASGGKCEVTTRSGDVDFHTDIQ